MFVQFLAIEWVSMIWLARTPILSRFIIFLFFTALALPCRAGKRSVDELLPLPTHEAGSGPLLLPQALLPLPAPGPAAPDAAAEAVVPVDRLRPNTGLTLRLKPSVIIKGPKPGAKPAPAARPAVHIGLEKKAPASEEKLRALEGELMARQEQKQVEEAMKRRLASSATSAPGTAPSKPLAATVTAQANQLKGEVTGFVLARGGRPIQRVPRDAAAGLLRDAGVGIPSGLEKKLRGYAGVSLSPEALHGMARDVTLSFHAAGRPLRDIQVFGMNNGEVALMVEEQPHS